MLRDRRGLEIIGHVLLQLTLLLCFHVFVICGQDTKFPNINFLGMRYDIVKSNPLPTDTGEYNPAFDGGKNVVDMSDYSEGKMYENKWLIPNNVDGKALTGACSYEASFSEVADAFSYQESLSMFPLKK